MRLDQLCDLGVRVVDSRPLPKPGEVGRAALDDEPREALVRGGRKLRGRQAAQAPAHHEAPGREALLVEQRVETGEHGVRVADQRGEARHSIAPAVSAIVDDEQVGADSVVDRGDPVVVARDLAVAVKEQHDRPRGIQRIEATDDLHPLLDLDAMIRGSRRWTAHVASRVEETSRQTPPIEQGVIRADSRIAHSSTSPR